jgi:hypothetical protein
MRQCASVLFIAMLVGAAAPEEVLSFAGAGPVQLGMTVAAAEAALGAKFDPISMPFDEACWITSRADGKDRAIAYAIASDKIVRIDIAPEIEKIRLRTAAGIGIGSTEAELRRVYPGIKIGRAPYFAEGNEIEDAKTRAEHGITEPEPSPEFRAQIESPDHQRGMYFDTKDGKVIALATGFKPAIDDMEICR